MLSDNKRAVGIAVDFRLNVVERFLQRFLLRLVITK